MYRLWIIDEKDKSGRVHPRLRSIVNLQRLVVSNGRIMATDSLLYQLVEARGRNTQVTHIGNIQHRFKQRLYMVTCFGRGKDNWGIRNELQPFGDNATIGFCTFDLLVGIWQLTRYQLA